MDKNWFKEKLVDKLLIGILAAIISIFALKFYEDSNDRVSYAQKHVDVSISTAKDAYTRLTNSLVAVQSADSGVEKEVILRLQLTSIAARHELNNIKPALMLMANGHEKSMSAALAKCEGILDSEPFMPHNIANYQGKISELLKPCQSELFPAFGPYLRAITQKNFNDALADHKVNFFLFHVSKATLWLIGLLLGLMVISLRVYQKLPDSKLK